MSTKTIAVLCTLIVVCCASAVGQNSVADSLEHLLSKSKGQSKVDVLNQLTYEYISVDNDKVRQFNSDALTLSKKINYLKGEALAYTYRGVYEYLSAKFPEAHHDLHMGLRLSQKADDKQNIGYTFLQLGNCGLEEVDTDSAYLYFKKAIAIFKDSANPEALSKVYRNMSALYGQRFQADSQQYYLDRAIAIRRLLPDKTLLVDALAVQATLKLSRSDLDGAEHLLDEADVILKHYPNDLENLHDVHHIRALILFQKGKFDEAVVLFDSARNYYFKTSLYRKYITLLTDLAKIFSDRGEYELALNNFYDALELSRARGFETETYIIRNRIGWVNFHLGDLKQALRLANESLSSRPKKLLTSDLATALTLKGVVLTDLNRFDEAKAALDSVLKIYTIAGNLYGTSETLLNLAALETSLHHYDNALRLYSESVKLAERINYTFGLAWSNWGIGDIYFRQKKYAKASLYLDRSEKYGRLIHANKTLIRNFDTRRDLLAAQGRYKESLEYSMKANELKDSIHLTDLARRFVNLEKMQEIEQRDRNIKELQKDKQLAEDRLRLQESQLRQQYILIIAGAVGLVLLGLLVFIYYRFYKRIKILNVTVTEKNKRIHAQASKLQQVNTELNRLYHEVSEQNEEIQAQANDLAASNRNISDLNRGLERIVADKTVELRRTNEELVKHNNELLQFSYTVSHNLRGPVARLLGLATVVQNEKDLDQARQMVNLIAHTASELDLIIKDLSKILLLRNGLHQFKEPVDLEKEWQQSIGLLHESLEGDEEIISDFHLLPQLTTVRALLQSVFYNLLSNAIKFRSPSRRLRVTARSRSIDGKAVIEISDNGLGINTQVHKDKMFKLYSRFHLHVEGRGLGLYLIKSQIEVLHGDIEVTSKPDEGSQFRVILPISEREIGIKEKKEIELSRGEIRE